MPIFICYHCGLAFGSTKDGKCPRCGSTNIDKKDEEEDE